MRVTTPDQISQRLAVSVKTIDHPSLKKQGLKNYHISFILVLVHFCKWEQISGSFTTSSISRPRLWPLILYSQETA